MNIDIGCGVRDIVRHRVSGSVIVGLFSSLFPWCLGGFDERGGQLL